MKVDEIESTFNPKVTVLIPCLNEAESLPAVLHEIFNSELTEKWNCEVLIADNGSVDGSQQIALDSGCRVVNVDVRGYGSALMGGIQASRGEWVIMGDADGSYSFSESGQMLQLLENGYEVVIGNRFKGGISPGAMPFLHKYLGNPLLSLIGRILYRIEIRDFHCGLRAFSKEKIQSLDLNSSGMEFASEMLVKASKAGLKITEVPVTLKPDLRSRRPHLRTWADGWRHLRFLLAYSPQWVFQIPAIFALLSSVILFFLGINEKLVAGRVEMSNKSIVFVSSFTIVFAVFSSGLGLARLMLNPKKSYARFHTEIFSLSGFVLLLSGLTGALVQFFQWKTVKFGTQPVTPSFVHSVLFASLIVLGSIIIVHGFLIGLLRSQSSE